MNDFMMEILGERLLITIDAEDITTTFEAKADIIEDKLFLIGENNFSLSVDELSIFTREEDKWIVKTPKNHSVFITALDKIRQ